MTTHHIFPRSVHYLRVTCHSIVFGCKRYAPSLNAYTVHHFRKTSNSIKNYQSIHSYHLEGETHASRVLY